MGGDWRSLRERAASLLETFRLGRRLGARVEWLSGGEQQRVAIARAMINAPELILADEPTGNLDSACSLEIMELLTSLNRDLDITIVMVTHEPDMAAFARRIVHFKDGLIERDDARKEATCSPCS